MYTCSLFLFTLSLISHVLLEQDDFNNLMTQHISARTHLHRKARYFGVGQRLRHSGHPDSEASEHIHLKPLQLVPGQPGQDRQPGLQGAAGAAASGPISSQQRPVHCTEEIRSAGGEPGEEVCRED